MSHVFYDNKGMRLKMRKMLKNVNFINIILHTPFSIQFRTSFITYQDPYNIYMYVLH